MKSELKTVLTDTPHEFVKIGAKDGSGYFYAGKPDVFLKHMNEYSDGCLNWADNRVQTSFHQIELIMPSVGMTWDEYRAECRKTMLRANKKDFSDRLSAAQKRLTALSESLRRRLMDRSQFKRLDERSVVEKFDADPAVDEDCLVVIVDGCENGGYWMLSEAQDGEPLSFGFGGMP